MNSADEKMLIAKTEDLFSLCDKYAQARFSSFLDSASQAVINDNFSKTADYQTIFFGGYEDAERKIYGVFPSWQETDISLFPISILKLSCQYKAQLSHRDYLGAILSLGIDRNKIGDILVDEQMAWVFTSEDISSYIKDNLNKIGRIGIKIENVFMQDLVIPERKFELLDVVCASLRVDAVLAGALSISRNDSKKLIESGRIQINHKLCEDSSKMMKINDLISARGFGRFTLFDVGGMTRKGRTHISLKRYI